ncbi:kappa-type opioid receptor-like [Ptychodera flava]|uniref:kappa-type opioid receptor-like n=1 Tax=Ptychodera flava TaxID=63121 RepID=UPI003969D12B
MLVLVITFGSVGVLGNTAFIFVVARVPTMRTLPNYYIINLAFADALCLVSLLLQPVLYPYSFTNTDTYVFVRVLVMDTGTFTSVTTVAMISADRYVALCRPMKSGFIKHRYRVLILIAVTWVIGVTLGLCEFITVTVFVGRTAAVTVVLIFAIVTVTFLFLVVMFYSLIAKEFARNFRLKSSCLSNSSARRLSEEKQVLGVCLIIAVVFFVCNAPNVYLLLLSAASLFFPSVDMASNFNQCMNLLSPLMMILNFALNPFLYNIPSGNHRHAFRKAFSHNQSARGIAIERPLQSQRTKSTVDAEISRRMSGGNYHNELQMMPLSMNNL